MYMLKEFIRSSFKSVGVGITSDAELQRLRKAAKGGEDLTFVLMFPDDCSAPLLRNLGGSKSQLRQDLFVLAQLGFKRDGYFVEFGATNGVGLSNTHILEKSFGWRGILAEPAKCWHSQLKANRSAIIETRCVWSVSGAVLKFNEVDDPELSTIEQFSSGDLHQKARESGKSYEVQTVSLNDMLEQHQAPSDMDYLSIDTEGSEFEILQKLDFNKYRFRVITCEHNYTPMREEIFNLLSRHGYVRKFTELSRFDDWYVKGS